MFLALLTRNLRVKEVKRLIQWANVFLGQKMSPSAPQAQERKNLCCVLGRRKLEISVKLNCCFRKSRGTRDQIANIHWIIEKAREFQKNIYFCFIDYAKAFDCVDHNKLWKILKEMGIPDTWPAPWETCMQVRKQQLELDMEQQTGWKRSTSRLYIVTLFI